MMLFQLRATLMVEHKPQTSMASLIRKQISIRIFSCVILILFSSFFYLYSDVNSWLASFEKQLEPKAKELEQFIISQVLIDNTQAIRQKLVYLNQHSTIMRIEWTANSPQPIADASISFKFPFDWLYIYPIKTMENQQFGQLILSGSLLANPTILANLLGHFGLIGLFTLLLLMVLLPLSKKIPAKLFLDPINDLLKVLSEKGQIQSTDPTLQTLEINTIKATILKILAQYESQSRNAAFGEFSLQVAHDIRSHVVALETASKDLAQVAEPQRILIRNATMHIRDIANNLLSSYLDNQTFSYQVRDVLLISILEFVISEKRFEITHRNISLEPDFALNSFTSFVRVIPRELRNILSNICNNAIDALGEKGNGKIIIRTYTQQDAVVIQIIDNGQGIPAEQLPKLFTKGYSLKPKGNGFGLFHAKQHIASWGGSIQLASELQVGTTVTITLATCSIPTWFCKQMSIFNTSTLVVVDDNDSIFNLWAARLKELKLAPERIKYFHDPELFLKWYNACQRDPAHLEYIFLIDYEFVGTPITGLDVLKQMQISNQRYLVTDQVEDTHIHHECQILDLKIIPKFFAPHIPIHLLSTKPDIILLEPDEILARAWAYRAQQHALNLKTYFTKDDFNNDLRLYSDEQQFYIAHEFQEIVANVLAAGFTKVSVISHDQFELTMRYSGVNYLSKYFNPL